MSGEAFPFRAARTIEIGGAAVLAQRITYVGELGYELYVPREWAVQVWDALVAAAAPRRSATRRSTRCGSRRATATSEPT